MVNELSDLDVKEVSLVSRAANRRKYLLLKSDGHVDIEGLAKKFGDNTEVLEKKLQEAFELEKKLSGNAVREPAANLQNGGLKMSDKKEPRYFDSEEILKRVKNDGILGGEPTISRCSECNGEGDVMPQLCDCVYAVDGGGVYGSEPCAKCSSLGRIPGGECKFCAGTGITIKGQFHRHDARILPIVEGFVAEVAKRNSGNSYLDSLNSVYKTKWGTSILNLYERGSEGFDRLVKSSLRKDDATYHPPKSLTSAERLELQMQGKHGPGIDRPYVGLGTVKNV